jgi:hypothetical protein
MHLRSDLRDEWFAILDRYACGRKALAARVKKVDVYSRAEIAGAGRDRFGFARKFLMPLSRRALPSFVRLPRLASLHVSRPFLLSGFLSGFY